MKTWLTDVVPPKARKYVYAVLMLAAIVLAAYQATDGDWYQTAVFVLAALGFGGAVSNTDVKP